jgi:hypothetical protein
MMSCRFKRNKSVVTMERMREVDIKEGLGVDMDEGEDKDTNEVEVDPPLSLTVVK